MTQNPGARAVPHPAGGADHGPAGGAGQGLAQAPAGQPTRDQAAALTGAELLRAILAGSFAQPPICETMGFRLTEAEPGRVVFEGVPGARHANPLGGIHGGWFGTLLDSCMGCAVHSLLPRGRGYTTLEYKVNLIRAPKPDAGPLRAIGLATHVGRSTGVAEGRLEDAAGRLYAAGSTTCLIFDL